VGREELLFITAAPNTKLCHIHTHTHTNTHTNTYTYTHTCSEDACPRSEMQNNYPTTTSSCSYLSAFSFMSAVTIPGKKRITERAQERGWGAGWRREEERGVG